MLVSSALSLFFIFWGVLSLLDAYLRNIQNSIYLHLVDYYGLSITPFQIRFYVNKVGGTSRSAPHPLLTSFHSSSKSWTSDQRTMRLLGGWFSIGAFTGLICFLLTPLYLLWLLVIEIINGVTHLKGTWQLFNPAPSTNPLISPLNALLAQQLLREEENFKAAIASVAEQNSLFYIPLQEHVQTGITPVIPGVNIPWAHLPLFVAVLIFAGAFHELGHAIAALHANIRLNGFGMFLFAVYPGAFTEIEADELGRSSGVQKLRIFSAGIWHNIILALIGVLILWIAPYFLLPLYGTGSGVVITDVNHKSGLYGSTGLQSGMVVDRINECEVRDGREWTRCLEALHEKQKLQFRTGYLVQYAKVRPMTASPDHVTSTAGSGEMQCCSEFENVTSLSHICFRYTWSVWNGDSSISTLTTSDYDAAKSRFMQAINPQKHPLGDRQVENDDGDDDDDNNTKNLARSRVRRANLKMNLLREMMEDRRNVTGAGVREGPIEHSTPAAKPTEARKTAISHACLPAVAITEHATCEFDEGLGNTAKELPEGYVCAIPALYNGTTLLKFQLKNRTKPVLFVGFMSEPLYMIDTMDLSPRLDLLPFWIPQLIELFGKYLVTFSLAMGLLNAVPCYGLDGQFICRVVVDYFCFPYSTSTQREKLTNFVVAAGTGVFAANMTIGVIKFLVNYYLK